VVFFLFLVFEHLMITRGQRRLRSLPLDENRTEKNHRAAAAHPSPTTPQKPKNPNKKDCCDGTDEPAGACPNKCLEASAAKRAALAKRVSDYKHALERRNEAADAAGEKRKEMAERLAAVGGEIEQAAAEVTAAEAEHASADAAAQKAREERRRKQEEEEQKKQEQKGGDEAAAAGVAAEPAAAAAEGEGGEKKEVS
jgi:hypothetical protein